MTDMHSGIVHRGLRYSVYLRQLSPCAYVIVRRNNWIDPALTYPYTGTEYTIRIKQRAATKLFGIPIGYHTRSLTKIVELAITKIEEYDATLEIFPVEEEECPTSAK